MRITVKMPKGKESLLLQPLQALQDKIALAIDFSNVENEIANAKKNSNTPQDDELIIENVLFNPKNKKQLFFVVCRTLKFEGYRKVYRGATFLKVGSEQTPAENTHLLSIVNIVRKAYNRKKWAMSLLIIIAILCFVGLLSGLSFVTICLCAVLCVIFSFFAFVLFTDMKEVNDVAKWIANRNHHHRYPKAGIGFNGTHRAHCAIMLSEIE